MKLNRQVTINQPINKVWQVAAEDFSNAYVWISGVYHSNEIDPDISNAGRVCTFENKENPFHAVEKITTFDAGNIN